MALGCDNHEVLTGHEADEGPAPLGAELPEGARFIGPIPGLRTGWFGTDVPSDRDLDTCVACGLCLPHCPTYRLTGEESASPRGRIAAMRAVNDGIAEVDDTFASFMDLCLACRACEDVCPSHVPFGRMMERARVQIEPLRTRRARFVRWLGLDVVLPRKKLLWLVAAFQPLARPFMGRRLRSLVPAGGAHLGRLPAVTEPDGEVRGTVALLSGCVQDRWFREVNLATIRVLARNGWRVVVPRKQVCCGALPAHNGRLGTARRLARKNVRAFAKADAIVVNAAGCGAHMQEVGDLLSAGETGAEAAHAFGAKVHDVMAFLHEHGIEPPTANPRVERVAYHDACHALRVQHVREQPRALLRQIPGLEVLDIANLDRCCGAAGLYNVTQPETADELQRQKVEAILATGATTVASANPGCTMQISAGLRAAGRPDIEVVHPIQLLDRAEST
jgi:glycolate oxidase iron-sulfur subunit